MTDKIARRLVKTFTAWGLTAMPAGQDPVVDCLWKAIDEISGDATFTAVWRGTHANETYEPQTPGQVIAALQAGEWDRAREVVDLDALERLHRVCRAARRTVPLVAPEWPDRREWHRAPSDELVVAIVATARTWHQHDIDGSHWYGLAGWITAVTQALAPGLDEAEAQSGRVLTYPALTIAEWLGAVDAASQRFIADLSPAWQRVWIEAATVLRAMAVEIAERP